MALFASPLEVTIRYSFSNLFSLFIGGLFVIPPIIAYFAIMILSEAFSENTKLLLALLGLVAIFFLACMAVPGGYIIGCLRDRRAGSLRMPDFFSDPVRLLKDSVAFFAMVVAYMICIVGLFTLLTTPIILLPLNVSVLAIMTMFVVMFVFMGIFTILATVLFFLSFVSMAVYVSSGSLFSALNPVKLVKVIAANPVAFLVALLIVYGVATVLQVFVLLILPIPWVFFFLLLTDALLVADVYLATETPARVPDLESQPVFK